MKKTVLVLVAVVGILMVGCDGGTTNKGLSIIGTWRTGSGNWELKFIDSSNMIITTPLLGWTGTATYTLSDQVDSENEQRGVLTIKNLMYTKDGNDRTVPIDVYNYWLTHNQIRIGWKSGTGVLGTGTYYKR